MSFTDLQGADVKLSMMNGAEHLMELLEVNTSGIVVRQSPRVTYENPIPKQRWFVPWHAIQMMEWMI